MKKKTHQVNLIKQVLIKIVVLILKVKVIVVQVNKVRIQWIQNKII